MPPLSRTDPPDRFRFLLSSGPRVLSRAALFVRRLTPFPSSPSRFFLDFPPFLFHHSPNLPWGSPARRRFSPPALRPKARVFVCQPGGLNISGRKDLSNMNCSRKPFFLALVAALLLLAGDVTLRACLEASGRSVHRPERHHHRNPRKKKSTTDDTTADTSTTKKSSKSKKSGTADSSTASADTSRFHYQEIVQIQEGRHRCCCGFLDRSRRSTSASTTKKSSKSKKSTTAADTSAPASTAPASTAPASTPAADTSASTTKKSKSKKSTTAADTSAPASPATRRVHPCDTRG